MHGIGLDLSMWTHETVKVDACLYRHPYNPKLSPGRGPERRDTLNSIKHPEKLCLGF